MATAMAIEPSIPKSFPPSSTTSSSTNSSSNTAATTVTSIFGAAYYQSKLDELELIIRDKTQNLRRLEAQRNALNTKGK